MFFVQTARAIAYAASFENWSAFKRRIAGGNDFDAMPQSEQRRWFIQQCERLRDEELAAGNQFSKALTYLMRTENPN